MDWTSWVEKVFDCIVREWKDSEEAQRHGVALLPEMLFPELPHPRVDVAVIYAYIDLDWLGLVEDPEVHNPTLAQVTDVGRQAIESGLAEATFPGTRTKCAALSLPERRFLERLVAYVRMFNQPAEYAELLTGRASVVGGDVNAEELNSITSELADLGLIVSQRVSDSHRTVDFEVGPLYAGFAVVDQQWFGLPPNLKAAGEASSGTTEIGGPVGEDDTEDVPEISLEEFKERIAIIQGREADRLREDYIARFVDTTSDHFRRYIAQPGPQGDEVCYTGYLWETLKQGEVITQDELLAKLSHWSEVYLFWDFHNATKIFIPDYWKFPLKAVLQVPAADLLHVVAHDWNTARYEDILLPEDIYLFEETMNSSLILTHETTDDRLRLCFEAG